MSDQKKLRKKVVSLSRNKRAIASRVTSLRQAIAERKKKVEEEMSFEIDLQLSAWELFDQEMRNLQGACRNKFHADTTQSGRCPDCNLFKPSS